VRAPKHRRPPPDREKHRHHRAHRRGRRHRDCGSCRQRGPDLHRAGPHGPGNAQRASTGCAPPALAAGLWRGRFACVPLPLRTDLAICDGQLGLEWRAEGGDRPRVIAAVAIDVVPVDDDVLLAEGAALPPPARRSCGAGDARPRSRWRRDGESRRLRGRVAGGRGPETAENGLASVRSLVQIQAELLVATSPASRLRGLLPHRSGSRCGGVCRPRPSPPTTLPDRARHHSRRRESAA
jgi:hypothetical protein